tara:strand:- start:1286 stop:2773 length:1488 start_codon:yes stop_codon:yes gene_type:complete
MKLFLFISLILINNLGASNICIKSDINRDISRQVYAVPEQIQSENFVIHFTTAEDDFQEINGQLYSLQSNYGYAQSIIDLAEYSLSIYLEQGWEDIPPDCDESITDLGSPDHCINFGGNSLYDIYISNDGPGMVVPENLYSAPPYTGGRTSYMKISTLSNNYTSIPAWSHHVVAHEVHHSVQLRYGVGTSGSPGDYIYNLWFFEQTASYMENVVFPNSNHVYTMLANCNVVTPLTYPNHGVDYPAEIYPYRSALWQKYLVESLSDSSIVRYMWEDYGLQFANGEPVSLLPIYENSINIATNNQYTMTEAFDEYALWRYLTGSRSITNNSFEQASGYCTASTFDIGETYPLLSNTGGAYYINIPQEGADLVMSSQFADDLNCMHIFTDSDNDLDISHIDINDGQSYISIDPISSGTQALIVNTKYNNYTSDSINFTINFNQNVLGDLNSDGLVNVVDVIIVVNLALESQFDYLADINEDGIVNIFDIVQMINMILY